MSKDKRAVSAVISTVIIVVVTVALAIAVSYWMGGLATIFIRFEKIEIKSADVSKADGNYNVTINFVNTGAIATSVDSVMLNGVPTTSAGWSDPITVSSTLQQGAPCQIGVQKNGFIQFTDSTSAPLTDPSGNALTTGVTLTIDIHTTGGKDYYTSVTLP